MKTVALQLKHLQETTFVWWLLGALVALIFGYLYYVNDAVQNVVLREKTERSIAEVHSRLSELEFDYVKLQEKLTIEYAHTLGFVEVLEPVFVSRGTSAPVLSFNNEI